LTTRLYFEGEALNDTDPVLALVTDESARRTLIATRVADRPIPTYRFDIRLQGDHETVFFEI
jgi:protocatechuate 3,4-dioxygenase alpha subunit